jgi:hypothetical protein
LKSKALNFLRKLEKHHRERIIALQRMAHPALGEIAAHREELDVVERLIPVVEAMPDEGAVVPAETSLQSEKRKWSRIRKDEIAKANPDPA